MRRTVNHLELGRRVQLDGARRTCRMLEGALNSGDLTPEDFSIQELAENLIVDRQNRPVGREWVRQLGPQKSGGVTLLEAASGVSLSGFTNITGQIFYNAIMAAYQSEAFIAQALVPNIPTRLSGERIPGITGLYENVMDVGEGRSYPELGFGEDYIDTPATTKRGLIVSVNKETIFFDRTAQVLQRASQVGEVLGRKKEKLLWDMIIGVTNNYKWRGTSYNTYQSATPWINLLTGHELLDWATVDAAEQLFANILEPNTDEPIIVEPDTVVVMPAKQQTARQIFGASQLRVTQSGQITQTIAPNTVTPYNVKVSKFAYRRIITSGVSASNAAKYWFLGNFAKAFAWMENWPITVVQAPDNSEADFKQDVVIRYKASERGIPAVMNPRYVVAIQN